MQSIRRAQLKACLIKSVLERDRLYFEFIQGYLVSLKKTLKEWT